MSDVPPPSVSLSGAKTDDGSWTTDQGSMHSGANPGPSHHANEQADVASIRHSSSKDVADDNDSTRSTRSELAAPHVPDSGTPNQEPPIGQKTLDLLKEILQTLSMSSTVGRVDQSTRARFWNMYKAEAEEFHTDFLTKYNSELDISLIFAGLFCGVAATFVVLMQPVLGPDPNLTTQVLLMMVVQSLNSTAFGDQALQLPTFNGPSRLTVWVQSVLYATLAASLFAALGAMLGKQWLSHYANVGEKGTAEERCVDRQRKFVALHTWHFHAVLACIPLLLQASLFLFIVGLAGYLWDQQRTISAILIVAATLVILFYTFTVLSSLFYSDCPFYTPISEAILILSRRIIYRTSMWGKFVKQQWDLLDLPGQVTGNEHHSGLQFLPMTVQQALPVSYGRGYETHQKSTIVETLMTEPRNSLLKPAAKANSDPEAPALANESEESTKYVEVDAPCVSWLLVTSTHPDVVTAAARMALEVSWTNNSQVDPLPMLLQLRDAFMSCFVFRRWLDCYYLLPHCGDRAVACGQAILHLYFQRGCLEQSSVMFGTLADIDKILMESKDLLALCRDNDVTGDDQDLYFVIQGLRALTDRPYLFTRDRESQVELNTSDPLDEWISEQTLLCLSNSNTPGHLRLYMLDVLCGQFLRGLHVSYRHVYYRYFLACACAMGYQPEPEELTRSDMSDHTEEALEYALSQLSLTILSHLHSSASLDRIHVTFAWELMEPLAELMENGGFLETFSAKKIHHFAILLCRTILGEQDISPEMWSWIDTWVRMSVLAVNPSNPARRDLSKDDKAMRGVWHCHYDDSDRHFLVPTDADWLLLVMRKVKALIHNHHSVKGIYLPRLASYCMALLCESPDIAGVVQSQALYADVAWALRSGGALGAAGVKLARAMCGQGRNVELGLLTNLVGGIENFSRSLSRVANTFYHSDSPNACKPEGYMFHMAYLDLVLGLGDLQDDLIQRRAHVQNCLELAAVLRTQAKDEGWRDEEATIMRACLGRDTDHRPWKQAGVNPTFASHRQFPNTYLRDAWSRIVQVVAKFLQAESLASFQEYRSERVDSDVMLTLACVSWEIYDTHPLPDEALSTISELLEGVLSSWRDTQTPPIRKQKLIQRVYRRVSRVVRQDDASNHPQPENKTPWSSALKILRSHIDETVVQLEPPLTQEELRLPDSENKDLELE